MSLRKAWAIISACVLLTVVAGLVLGGLPSPRTELVLVGMNIVVAISSIALSRVVRGSLDLFEPIVLFQASFSILFIIRPLFDLFRYQKLPLMVGIDVSSSYHLALVISLLGNLGFCSGYYLSWYLKFYRHLPSPPTEFYPSTTRILVIGIAGLGLLLFAVFIATSGGVTVLKATFTGRNAIRGNAIASSSGYFYDGLLWLLPAGLFLLGVVKPWRSKVGMLGLLLVLASQLNNIGAGNRSYTLPALLSVIVLGYLKSGRRPKLAQILVFGFLVFMFGISIPRTYRFNSQRDTSFGETVTSTLTSPIETFTSFFVSLDTAMVSGLAVEVQAVPSVVPYQIGTTFMEALTRPIPRDLWNAKPRAADTLLMGAIWPDLARQGIGLSFSLFGEPYLNFGILGIAPFGCAFGLVWGTLYDWFRANSRRIGAAVIYSACWPYLFVYMRGGIGADYQRQVITLLPLIVCVWLAGKSIRQRGASSPLAVQPRRSLAG